MKKNNKPKVARKPSRWAVFKNSYQRLSEENIALLGDKTADQHQNAPNENKEPKKVIKQASKRLKKATWSVLKAMYEGFLYSTYQIGYTSGGMPGMDPLYMPHTRMPAYYKRQYYRHAC